jgi:acetolactate synthase I/II/III large subunit
MAGRPAATLLHLGPGLGNGIANLHNARRARTPVVNVVGDHAIGHRRYDAPLQSDIESLARPVSVWYRSSADLASLSSDTAEAVAASQGTPPGVATLVVPADLSWTDGAEVAAPVAPTPQPAVWADAVEHVAKLLSVGEPTVILLGGGAVRARGLEAASRIARTSGARLLCETFPPVLERGAGVPPIERLAYLGEMVAEQLRDVQHLVLVGAGAPAAFFGYPGQPGSLVPAGCDVHVLATPVGDGLGALEALAYAVGAPAGAAEHQALARPERPTGSLNPMTAAAAIGALLPEDAVVSDEANTASLFLPGATAGAPRHDWLCLTGGAIGQGMPVATGAAVACPGRRVLSLEADGSAMYTLQSLWTQAREGLDVTTVIFNNGSYAILELELARVGAEASGPRAQGMLDLGNPALDFVSLARGMGVPATRATTAEEFTVQLEAALATPGPTVVEAMIGRGLGL